MKSSPLGPRPSPSQATSASGPRPTSWSKRPMGSAGSASSSTTPGSPATACCSTCPTRTGTAVIAVHLRGHFLLTRNAATYWRAKAKAAGADPSATSGTGGTVYGRIINTSSEAGLAGPVGQANYGAAKAGITALTLSAARALERYGVRANAIAPRARTAMTADVFGDEPELADGQIDPLSPGSRRKPGALPRLTGIGCGQRAAVHRLRSDSDAGCGAHRRETIHC